MSRCIPPLMTLLLLLSTSCSTGSAIIGIDRTPEAHTGFTSQKLVTAQSYMVATANPYASRAARHILKRGGSAIDATIAANMVLNLVEPQSSGLGGGAFLLHWSEKDRRLQSYDGRETAPKMVRQDLFWEEGRPMSFQQAVAGGRAVGVPGLLKCLEMAHREHGRLPWAELFTEAINLAEHGFIVSSRLSSLISGKSRTKLLRSPATTAYFFTDGKPIQAGQLLKNPALAETFRNIALKGSAALYRGKLAAEIVKSVNSDVNPGSLHLSDLAEYRAVERPPVCEFFFGYQICGMGPPSSGGISLLQMLGILEQTGIQHQKAVSAQTIHLFAQAGRLSFADRAAYIADPDYISVPTKALVNPYYLRLRAKLIDPYRDTGKAISGTPMGTTLTHYKTGFDPEQPGTSHISIIDQYGNGVAETASIEQAFGSGLMAGGFLLNNELTDFSFPWRDQDGKDIANRVEGKKRPRSSMAPTMVFHKDGSLKLVIGSPGGSRIIAYVAQTLLAILVWKHDIQSAIELPHFMHLNGTALNLEKNAGLEPLQKELEARGYRVRLRDLNSGLQGIVRTEQGLEGGADPRREGLVVGE